MRLRALAVIAICGSPLFLPSQSVSDPQDPAGSVRRLARQIEEDMREIDHLLQKASRPETEGLLVAATETQGKVIRGIDDMLAQLHEVCCTCPGGG